MNRITLVLAVFTAISLGAAADADARRMGSGSSVGASRPAATPRQAQPAPPAQNAAQSTAAAPTKAAAAPTAAAAAAAPKSGMSRWLGPIAGIAAGLGLAALLSHLGLSEAFGSFLLVLLLVVGAFFLIRMFMRRGANASARPGATAGPQMPAGRTLQYAGASGAPAAPNSGLTIGRGVSAFSSSGSGAAAAGTSLLNRPSFPPGFDAEPFVQQAKASFNRLQAAYDRADLGELRDFLTPDMAQYVEQEIMRRGIHQPTEVVQLDAEVMEVTTEADKHWASVRFSGLVREDGKASPDPFDEVWNLTKPVDGRTGWLLAGIQQLQ